MDLLFDDGLPQLKGCDRNGQQRDALQDRIETLGQGRCAPRPDALPELEPGKTDQGVRPGGASSLTQRLNAVLESIALLTVAVAALELGQTIIEEEVQREAQMSAPTRVRRFLSRFMIVLVVALSIEALVAVFRFSHEDPSQLPYAAAIGLTAAALLAAWGLFIWFNRSAEQLEPEAMEEAKQEDTKVE
ncbi:MAG TPA: hypothetical protein VHN13_18230 [Candidatus Tectomicrobia bacterium]|nr:hypothetical protein [Candidatus Tectomicrobia bacterium]